MGLQQIFFGMRAPIQGRLSMQHAGVGKQLPQRNGFFVRAAVLGAGTRLPYPPNKPFPVQIGA